MGVLAADLLKLDLPQADKRLYTFVETDGCFSDGVAVATGCWLGHRTMRLMDQGKTAVTFVDTLTGQAFRVWPNPVARELAIQLVPDAQSRWHAMVEAYQSMPTEELLCATPVVLNLDIKALVSRPGIRVNCDKCGEEIINEREIVADGRVLCQSCAGENYWSALMLTAEQI
jgi:formylmethanofuran dehydrogenase subunit E